MKRSPPIHAAIAEILRRSRRTLGLTASLLPTLLSVAALVGLTPATGSAAAESRCVRMLSGAPEGIRRLEAVQSCRGADAGCAYVEPAAGYGVLTLICPRSGVRQIVSADRLSMLQLRDGALVGECQSGSWQRDAGLPGCYPVRERVGGEP
jgi:hypothetical protein